MSEPVAPRRTPLVRLRVDYGELAVASAGQPVPTVELPVDVLAHLAATYGGDAVVGLCALLHEHRRQVDAGADVTRIRRFNAAWFSEHAGLSRNSARAVTAALRDMGWLHTVRAADATGRGAAGGIDAVLSAVAGTVTANEPATRRGVPARRGTPNAWRWPGYRLTPDDGADPGSPVTRATATEVAVARMAGHRETESVSGVARSAGERATETPPAASLQVSTLAHRLGERTAVEGSHLGTDSSVTTPPGEPVLPLGLTPSHGAPVGRAGSSDQDDGPAAARRAASGWPRTADVASLAEALRAAVRRDPGHAEAVLVEAVRGGGNLTGFATWWGLPTHRVASDLAGLLVAQVAAATAPGPGAGADLLSALVDRDVVAPRVPPPDTLWRWVAAVVTLARQRNRVESWPRAVHKALLRPPQSWQPWGMEWVELATQVLAGPPAAIVPGRGLQHAVAMGRLEEAGAAEAAPTGEVIHENPQRRPLAPPAAAGTAAERRHDEAEATESAQGREALRVRLAALDAATLLAAAQWAGGVLDRAAPSDPVRARLWLLYAVPVEVAEEALTAGTGAGP